MQALVNVDVFTGETVVRDGAVVIDGGRIAQVCGRAGLDTRVERHDLGGGILAAGFLDLQVNGGGGILFNGLPTVESLVRIGQAHRRFGTTGWLATVITDEAAVRQRAAAAVRDAMAAGVPGLLGIHFEGPHINPDRRGVHESRHIAPLDDAAAEFLLGTGIPHVLVTLAPERVPAATVRRLAAAGLRVAAGHSAAGWDEATAGFAAGITGVTHLYNAMSPLGSREPGLVGAALAEDGCWCGIIVDGHHVHDAAVRVAWKAKPAGRLFLVTDAMPPVGAPADQAAFDLYGQAIGVVGGRCVTADGRLAGSALDMATAVRNCVRRIGIPLEEALRMASAYPAAFMGMERERGRIAPGMAADLVHLAPDLTVRETWIGGISASH